MTVLTLPISPIASARTPRPCAVAVSGQQSQPDPILAGQQHSRHAGSLDVRAVPGARNGAAPGSGSTRPRPTSRSARRDPGELRPLGFPRRRRGSPALSEYAGSGVHSSEAGARRSALRFERGRVSVMGDVRPVAGTLAETYFGSVEFPPSTTSPTCASTRAVIIAPTSIASATWPAMIAAVTDLTGAITGAHRTWLSPDGLDEAAIDAQRKAMSDLLGHAVRFGAPPKSWRWARASKPSSP